MSQLRYSSWAEGLSKSDITEILLLSREPGVLSLAPGVPFPASYPTEKVAAVTESLISGDPEAIFPYPPLQGTKRCRDAVVYRMAKRGATVRAEQVVMSAGSQAAMDMVTRMIMNPGDTMIIEAPTFMGTLDSIKNSGFNLVEVPIDDNGIRTDILRDTLARLKREGVHPKMIYIMSNYHNPGGIMLSMERRRELPQIAEEYDCFIVEDDAYSELLYDESCDQTAVKAFDTTDSVIYLGSFSKLVSPGFRVGWAVVPEKLVGIWNTCRPMFDVGSPALNQEIIAELHRDNWLDGHIAEIKKGYRSRRDALLGALKATMPEELTWTPAHGGFYVWVTTPDSIDQDRLLHTAVKNKVVYFTGKFFYLDHTHHSHFRLCFSRPDENTITEAVTRLAKAVKEELGKK